MKLSAFQAEMAAMFENKQSARYFAVGKLAKDQIADYAERKGISLAEAERWLAPNLAYEPE